MFACWHELESDRRRAADVAPEPWGTVELLGPAAELLVPEPAERGAWSELVTQCHKEEGAVAACAAGFDVGPTAMRWRLFGLGLLHECDVSRHDAERARNTRRMRPVGLLTGSGQR